MTVNKNNPKYVNFKPAKDVSEKLYEIRKNEGISYQFQIERGLELYFKQKKK